MGLTMASPGTPNGNRLITRQKLPALPSSLIDWLVRLDSSNQRGTPIAMSPATPQPAQPGGLSPEQLPSSYFTWPGVLGRLGNGQELSESQVRWAMNEIMDGKATEAQIAVSYTHLTLPTICSV